MNKIIKISFVCASLFAFVNAQAQVIESVSFTPAKAGNYQTIATKSVTSFAGNLNASEINGLGYKLNLNTNTHLPFAANTTLGAHRDVYMLTTPTLPSTSTVSLGENGKLYTTGDTTVTNSTVNLIYGGDTDFSNAGGLITKNGVLKFHEVQMANPYCDIQWIKLPAIDVNHDYNGDPDHDNSFTPTFSDYWFAYCGTANTPEPSVGGWDISLENATIIGTCTAGWNGSYQNPGQSAPANSCGYNGNATMGRFECSAQTLKKCNQGAGVSYGEIIKNDIGSICQYQDDAITRTLVGYKRNDHDIAKCNGIDKPLADPVYNESISASTVVRVASAGLLSSQCMDYSGAENQNPLISRKYHDALEYIDQGMRKWYCGFVATTKDAAWNQINTMRHADCQGTGTDISDTPYCEDLYGQGYSSISLTNEQICQGIKDKNPAGINVNNFTCIKKGPDTNLYKAARVAYCKPYEFQSDYRRCKDDRIKCNPGRCGKNDNNINYENASHQKIGEPFAHLFQTWGVWCKGDISHYANPDDSIFQDAYNSDNITTVYYEQPVSGSILTCKWEN